jgi:hypothetical protein
MHHKDKRRIIAWLKDLREKQYIEWIYDGNDFINKTKPAVYSLDLNGIRHLRELDEYPIAELRKRYKEPSRTQAFIDKCILLANCCINLEYSSVGDIHYVYQLEADYLNPSSNDSRYDDLHKLKPNIYYEKSEARQKSVYIVYIFDATSPRYMIKKRLKDIAMYLYDEDWRGRLKTDSLAVHIACVSKKDLIYAKRFTARLLEDIGREDDAHIRFSTVDYININGVTGAIWEEV